ncbi:MAG: hypothetical protein EPO23_01325 [Xanthobacteraceae bacterium]|nr:MAG: hypothetical protein EPO23_01325 [Xanthobacteraceae bacterium]
MDRRSLLRNLAAIAGIVAVGALLPATVEAAPLPPTGAAPAVPAEELQDAQYYVVRRRRWWRRRPMYYYRPRRYYWRRRRRMYFY